jgi:hypothetical protein
MVNKTAMALFHWGYRLLKETEAIKNSLFKTKGEESEKSFEGASYATRKYDSAIMEEYEC